VTGPDRDGEEQEHLVVHWDAGTGAEDAGTEASQRHDAVDGEPEPARPGLLDRYRYGFAAVLLLSLLSVAAYAIGAATYNPPSRLPALAFGTQEALYGTNEAVSAELELVREAFADAAALDLEPAGTVFRLPLPRTVADRLFGKRDEVATVFVASNAAGEVRFLALSEGGEARILAVEAPLGLSGRDQPTGVFVALDPGDATLSPLIEAIEAVLPALDGLRTVEISPDDYYVFGPFEGADTAALRSRIVGNAVMAHLVAEIEAADGHVSLAAPAFLVLRGPSRGTINALYHPARSLVMEPLWGESSTASLAHELVHAYMDTAVANRAELLPAAADYFEGAHPVLHGQVVGDLYERLGREDRAEETLAFLVGAIAAQQTKTVSTQRLLENPGNLAISEAVLYADIGLLVQIGLLPPCMLPSEDMRGEITQEYYDDVASACE